MEANDINPIVKGRFMTLDVPTSKTRSSEPLKSI